MKDNVSHLISRDRILKNFPLQMSLFTDNEGNPLMFTIASGPYKKSIRKLIESNGGEVINNKEMAFANICNSDHRTNTSDLISLQFIHDCISQNKLLDKEDYLIRNLPDKPRERDSMDDDSEDKTSPAPKRKKFLILLW